MGVWSLWASNVRSELWRCLSLAEDEDGNIQINGVMYNASKFAAIEQGFALEMPETSIIDPFNIGAPTELNLTESLYQISPVIVGARVTFSWLAPTGAVRFQVAYQSATGQPVVEETGMNSIDVQPTRRIPVLASRKILGSLFGVTVLLAACGGGNSGNDVERADADYSSASAPGGASASGAASAPDGASSPQPAAFNCPENYKRLDITTDTAPGIPVTLVTDDNIATLTLNVPASGVSRPLTVCMGKPDPVPAGVQADYVYEITAHGNYQSVGNRLLTFNFTTNQPVTGLPMIELATVTSTGVIYSPTVPGGAQLALRPNYSISAYTNQTGLYVIRLMR
jgi:hypothetical protein